jgi:hypothetical protein
MMTALFATILVVGVPALIFSLLVLLPECMAARRHALRQVRQQARFARQPNPAYLVADDPSRSLWEVVQAAERHAIRAAQTEAVRQLWQLGGWR